MKKRIHFRHLFHAAGHGTFFSGDIFQDVSTVALSWGYDCGSRRESHLRGLLHDYLAQSSAPRFELFCISHFDSDHVNGIHELRSSSTVDTLVLPYIPLQVRLELACQLDEAASNAGAAAAFTADPLAYLAGRGYGERLGRVVFIQGGEERPPKVGAEPRSEVVDLNHGGTGSRGGVAVVGELQPVYDLDRSTSRLAEQALMVSHQAPWVLADLYEWTFFNKHWPKCEAPASGKTIYEVAREVSELVNAYELCGSRAPKPGWLDALKSIYAANFGASSRRRNEISLCVLGLPLLRGPLRPCRFFNGASGSQIIDRLSFEADKPGVLLLGDFALTPKEVAAMSAHFGGRWDQIGVVQIPHHGSRHNWRPGVLDACNHRHNVICAPGTPNHPHKDVIEDLSNYWLADYARAVEYAYHA